MMTDADADAVTPSKTPGAYHRPSDGHFLHGQIKRNLKYEQEQNPDGQNVSIEDF